MDHNNEKVIIDPDYAVNNNALRIKEEKNKEENKLTSEKLNNVIVGVFDEEINERQKQLEEVEEKICKAQKLLHLVRYVLITSYYKKSSLEISPEEEGTTPGFDKQNRIHPAVKKLLGSNPRLDIFCAGKGKRRLASRSCDKDGSSSQAPEIKRPKLDTKVEASPLLSPHIDQNYSKNRKKTRHRLVIGNVSKWVPSPEDNTTHKWMMYVRGDKDKPDISHIVEKVVFYLHPSYKPHDVVEVQESPFHLSRRGWGEFPLRVQIFFKCPLNKPISIVHNLRLEKTFTGRQTLGNETLVDVYLHENILLPKPETITKPPDNSPSKPFLCDPNQTEDSSKASYNNIFNSFDSLFKQNDFESDYIPLDKVKSEIKSEPPESHNTFEGTQIHTEVNIKSEPVELLLPISKNDSTLGDLDHTATNMDLISTRSDSAYGCSDTASMSFEHDYCDVIEEQFVDNEIEVKEDLFVIQFLSEHSYSVLSGTENWDSSFENKTVCHDTVKVEGNNKLVFGLGETYLKQKAVNVHNEVPKNLVSQKPLDPPRILLQNGCADSQNTNKSICRITLPPNRFKNIGEALPYLLRRFKLWNENAKNEAFKKLYPYIASTQQEFEKWPLGKQLNAEWNRARDLKKILGESFPSLKKWSTKACFMFVRSHRFDSPVTTLSNFFKNTSEERSLMNECFDHSVKDVISIERGNDIDQDVDIESDGNKYNRSQKSTFLDISEASLKNHCTYIKEAALDCGIILRSEEISDGIIMNAAERMILEAVKCLAEGLIRRANHHLVCKKDYRDGHSEITMEEVNIALTERSELQSIKTFQKKKREIEYFT